MCFSAGLKAPKSDVQLNKASLDEKLMGTIPP